MTSPRRAHGTAGDGNNVCLINQKLSKLQSRHLETQDFWKNVISSGRFLIGKKLRQTIESLANYSAALVKLINKFRLGRFPPRIGKSRNSGDDRRRRRT